MELDELMGVVDSAFSVASARLPRWDDPHPPPEREVAEDEYSRVTDPERWRIIGARADAWMQALTTTRLATVERDADPRWTEMPGTVVTRTDLVRPTVEGGLPLVLCRSRLGDVPDAGVTLGVGEPAVVITFIPDCGCDACDSGSQDVLDQLDSYIRPVVSGEFRFLRRGRQSIMVLEDGTRQGQNIDVLPAGDFRFLASSRPSASILGGSRIQPRHRGRTDDRMTEILADPTGWGEVSGPSWLTRSQSDMRQ